jgi:hypothetical protein
MAAAELEAALNLTPLAASSAKFLIRKRQWNDSR